MRKTALFLTRLFTNPHKDNFITRLGVTLLLNKFNLTGPIADLLGYTLRSGIGLLIEVGIFKIDLTLDAYKEGAKLKEFKEGALDAYNKTISKIHDPQEKDEIRKEYLRLIALIGNVGNPK